MIESLKKLGFNDKEAEVYLAILKQGKASPALISRLTKINRSTVYAVAKNLEEKGIVAQDLAGKIIFFTALPLENLNTIIKKEEDVIEEKKKIIALAIAELTPLTKGKNYSVPKIRFVEDDDIENFLYQQMQKWNDNARQTDGACWGFQDHTFAEKYQKWILWANKTFKLKVNLLSNDSKIEHKLKKEFDEARKIVFWKKDVDFSSSIWIMGDYLIMIITRQKPYYLVEINDTVLAYNLREVFKQIWKEK